MRELLHQLGIDWRLLLAQAVNFAIVLFVLRAFAYKPLMDFLKRRRERIEEGLRKAEEAGMRLKEVDVIGKKKLKAAEEEALGIVKRSEAAGREAEAKILGAAKAKGEEALRAAAEAAARKAAEAAALAEKNIKGLVRAVLVKTVEMEPEKVDDALIERALAAVRKK